jgi:hypothetical protein
MLFRESTRYLVGFDEVTCEPAELLNVFDTVEVVIIFVYYIDVAYADKHTRTDMINMEKSQVIPKCVCLIKLNY